MVADEKAVKVFLEVLQSLRGRITFTSLILSGEAFKNKTNEGIKIGVDGFGALMEMFAEGHF